MVAIFAQDHKGKESEGVVRVRRKPEQCTVPSATASLVRPTVNCLGCRDLRCEMFARLVAVNLDHCGSELRQSFADALTPSTSVGVSSPYERAFLRSIKTLIHGAALKSLSSKAYTSRCSTLMLAASGNDLILLCEVNGSAKMYAQWLDTEGHSGFHRTAKANNTGEIHLSHLLTCRHCSLKVQLVN